MQFAICAKQQKQNKQSHTLKDSNVHFIDISLTQFSTCLYSWSEWKYEQSEQHQNESETMEARTTVRHMRNHNRIYGAYISHIYISRVSSWSLFIQVSLIQICDHWLVLCNCATAWNWNLYKYNTENCILILRLDERESARVCRSSVNCEGSAERRKHGQFVDHSCFRSSLSFSLSICWLIKCHKSRSLNQSENRFRQ